MVYIPELDRQGFADRQSIENRRTRPATNFTQRDDVREFAGSGIGQNYHKMMDLQRQSPTFKKNDPRTDNLKQRRRQFNQYDKYNAGSIFGITPQEMQEDYRYESNELRNRAKPVYNEMYPLQGGFMDYADQGGIYGMLLKSALGGMKKDITGMGRDIRDNIGIGGAAKRKILEEEKTFGIGSPTFEGSEMTIPNPHQDYLDDSAPTIEDTLDADLKKVEYDDYLAREAELQGLLDAEQYRIDNSQRNASSDILDDAIENQWPTVNEDDYYSKSKQGEMVFAEPTLQGMAPPELIEETEPFNDNLREAGIASMMKSGLNLAGRRPYEDEYRAFVESSGPSKVMVTYDDFMETYLPRIQESRGVLRAPLNSQGRR